MGAFVTVRQLVLIVMPHTVFVPSAVVNCTGSVIQIGVEQD